MEIKINKEIRQYRENVFFGMDLRQLLFSAGAVGAALVSWVLFRKRLGTEAVSWICMLAAAPFAALGFVSYNGMNAGQLLLAWFRSEVLGPVRVNAARDCFYRRMFRPEAKGGGR